MCNRVAIVAGSLCEVPTAILRSAALVLLIVGQALALDHEAETRHVRCAEHGELLEVANNVGSHDDGCGQSHLIAVDGDASTKHQDCAISRLLRTSTRASIVSHLHVTATELIVVQLVATIERPHAVDIISLAPKTSPPV